MTIRPDWEAVSERIDTSLPHSEQNSAWTRECNEWLTSVGAHYGSGYRITETENFSVLSDESDRYVRVFSDFLEYSLKRIKNTLSGITSDEGLGNHVAIIFKDPEQYYDYLQMFFPDEGEFGLSSGIYINEGYGHFAFPSQDIEFAEPIAVHELTHACLVHLPIPLWLNEGLAVLMEDVLAGQHLYLDQEIFSRHQNYWNPETIQKFWSGESFQASDEGQELSYNLAHVLVRNLSRDYDLFASFVNAAKTKDAGEQACKDHFSCSLAEVIKGFLGKENLGPADHQ